MKTVLETFKEITENKWFMLVTAIIMMNGSIGLLWRITKTMTKNRETYKTNKGKIEVNNGTYIEVNNKLYRLLAFKLNGDAIIQELWPDEKTHMVIKGEHKEISKKEIIEMIEHSANIVKGP